MEQPKKLTKQEKKLKKYLFQQETRKEKRKRAHQLKKQKRNQMLGDMSEEERKCFILQERSKEEAINKESERVSKEGIPVIFDMSYCSLMSSVELGSLQSQISDSFGFLRQQHPQYLRLLCCNVPEELSEKLSKRGAKRWGLTLRSEDILSLPETEQCEIIYLSPDASEPLLEVKTGGAYVIGGLVDRTIQSCKSLQRGTELGVSVRRLPIKEFLPDVVKAERRVFNVNTVIQVLHWIAAGMDCKNAMMTSIPKRWKN